MPGVNLACGEAQRGACIKCWAEGVQQRYETCQKHVPQFDADLSASNPVNVLAAKHRGLRWNEAMQLYSKVWY